MRTSRKVSFSVIALVLLVLATEGGLRVYFHYAGYHVGSLAPGWQQVHRVDSLVVSHSYYTDSTGIFRADVDFWEKMGIKIDSNGFRGQIDKRVDDTIFPTLLLIGDSYAWGAGASNLERSFSDLIKGKAVYNTGIPGADPAQYALIADSILPKLPVHAGLTTAIMLYLGNDIMDEYRPAEPNKPLYYITNTGWLPGFYNGKYFSSANASYQYYRDKYTPQSWFAQVACRTAIGTLLVSLPVRLQEKKEWEGRKKSSITNSYLRHIAETCKKQESKLAIFVIPFSGTDLCAAYGKDPKAYLLKEYPSTFTGLEDIMYPMPMEKADYIPLPDGHFNDQGHAKAAKYIIQTLQSQTSR